MNRSHVIELDPTFRQRQEFAKACGVARYTYNWGVAEAEKHYQETGKTVSFSQLKIRWNKEKPAWVYESPKGAHSQPFSDLRQGYQRFFKKLGNKPVFKKKGRCRDSFYVANDRLYLGDRSVKLPKIGIVRLKESPRFDGKIMSGTVSRRADRWFLSVSYELPDIPSSVLARVIGVDLGVKDLAVTSDGTRFPNPKHLKRAKRRLRLAHRRVSRRQKGSANRRKAVTRLARIHYRAACQRKDTLHKVTAAIARSASTVVIEDLNVSGMVKNHNLAAAISDCGFYEFRRQLEYKAKKVILADRWFPSSRLCHKCGAKNTELKLKDRWWTCACGATHDRDLNAALNLKQIGMNENNSVGQAMPEITPVKTGVPKRVFTLRSRSLKQEPSRDLKGLQVRKQVVRA